LNLVAAESGSKIPPISFFGATFSTKTLSNKGINLVIFEAILKYSFS